VSESADMPVLGMSEEHLRDASAEIARHLLALGARLVYGGDLRVGGFSELLFELVARHRRDVDIDDARAAVISVLAWPNHIQLSATDVQQATEDLNGMVELVCLGLYGGALRLEDRLMQGAEQPTADEWIAGLSSMRQIITETTDSRIVLGGRTEGYKGRMPGVAEEALMSLNAGQPLFLLGGFGGCSRDIAEAISLVEPWSSPRTNWNGWDMFSRFSVTNLNNGLTPDENALLAKTPHIDQAIALVIRGLVRLNPGEHDASQDS
jgi:hypothetical protein